ncbi:MAG: hypothetical protein R2695_12995 [Acidimicrobiales bacterium]
MEQYGLVFLWHHPHGDDPSWDMLDVFGCHPGFDTTPDDYYPPYPTFVRKDSDEPVHPQIVLENSADSAHFEFVHRASVTPRLLHWAHDEHVWDFVAGYPNTRSDDPDEMILELRSRLFGLGGAISIFSGVQSHRMVFATTPVDVERSDRFYTLWWRREPDDTDDLPGPAVVDRIQREFLSTVDDDLRIWRNQKWVDNPAYSKVDAKGYAAFRTWAQRFYDVGPEGDA